MTRVIEFLISLLIVAALFVVIGLFLPSKRSFTYSVETNRPMATVNDLKVIPTPHELPMVTERQRSFGPIMILASNDESRQ